MHFSKQINFNKLSKFISRFLCSGATQIETSKMSCLKKTNLKDTNNEAFELFQKLTNTCEIDYLHEAFKKSPFEMRLAGGGVRDILCLIEPNDIDFATDAKPDEMIELLKNDSNFRLITTKSGIQHGTVTVRVNNKSQYELTTLRIDRNTDGRHAQVEFINDWKLDASRRDLTINSMFIDLNGILYDYFNGESDLKNNKIRFVGDPIKRIQEDYLRIFRYFRFHSRFGTANDHDSSTLSVMTQCVPGLEQISGERIWSEMKRIFSISSCNESIELMFQKLKIGKYLGFTFNNVNLDEFNLVQKKIMKKPSNFILKPQTLLASLIQNINELITVTTRLKLSNFERDGIFFIISNRNNSNDLNIDVLKRKLALAANPNQSSLKDHIVQYLVYLGEFEMIEEIKNWQIPKFPFNGSTLNNRVKTKREIGHVLERLKYAWADSDYTMSEDQFEKEIEKILNSFI